MISRPFLAVTDDRDRVAVSSLLDLESKYNRAIEEKTLLEGEVIHRQELEEECQRLKDDVRGAFRVCCF